tara:strand:+ start:180 stop:374 length:195 start_codon:yes stop_codon:yes gene_type:complete
MSTEEKHTIEEQLSEDQLKRIAESFENLNNRLERYDKTLSSTLSALGVMSVLFLAGAGLASMLY